METVVWTRADCLEYATKGGRKEGFGEHFSRRETVSIKAPIVPESFSTRREISANITRMRKRRDFSHPYFHGLCSFKNEDAIQQPHTDYYPQHLTEELDTT